MGTNRVQEVTVVTYDQYRMLKIREIVLQPRNRFQVEVVRRLIQQQVIRLTIKRTRQKDTHFLLTAQVLHHAVMDLLRNTQTTQQAGGIALGVPSLHLGKLLLQLRNTDTILVTEIRLSVEGVLLAHDLPQDRMSHQDRVHDRILIKSEVVLAQDRQALARS